MAKLMIDIPFHGEEIWYRSENFLHVRESEMMSAIGRCWQRFLKAGYPDPLSKMLRNVGGIGVRVVSLCGAVTFATAGLVYWC